MNKSKVEKHKAFLSWLLDTIKIKELQLQQKAIKDNQTFQPLNDKFSKALDSDSLELALNALNQLQSSGKMVGMISHVEAQRKEFHCR